MISHLKVRLFTWRRTLGGTHSLIYQTRKTVFHHVSTKTPRRELKNDAQRSIFEGARISFFTNRQGAKTADWSTDCDVNWQSWSQCECLDLQLWIIRIKQSDDNEGEICKRFYFIYVVKPQVAPVLLLYFMIFFMILLHYVI